MPAGGYDLLASTTISGNTTNEVSFSGIPSTYTNLVVMFRSYEPNSLTSDVYLRVNGLTTSIYSTLGSSVEESSNESTQSQSLVSRADLTTNSAFRASQDNFLWLEIYNYNAARQKTFVSRFTSGVRGANTARMAYYTGNINTTATVSSVQIGLISTSRYFGNGSNFWLYGIYGI
jgi:hypothetical protein